ncbi:hypothetical protein BC332_18008 [Capsicum chinense]|nr:hypothetical protein BC332_18008 [Capsicum chinense]
MIKNNFVDQYYYQLGSLSRFGFLILTVKKQIEIIRPLGYLIPNRGEHVRTTILKKGVQPFKIAESPIEFVKNIELALRLSDLLFEVRIPHVANVIFDYLSSSYELFGEKLNLLGSKLDDDEFYKIVVVIDVDMLSKQIGIVLERSLDACSFSLTELYETLTNDGDSNNRERLFYLRVDRVQQSSDGVCKKRKLDTNVLEIQYAFDVFNVQEILNALFDFFTLKKEFLRKVEDFVGKIQKFRVIKSGLKIMKLEMKNVSTFELEDICPVCLKNFEEESVMSKLALVAYTREGCLSFIGLVKKQIDIIRPLGYLIPNRGEHVRTTILKKGVQPFKIVESPIEFVKNNELALRLSDLLFEVTIPHVANVIFYYLSSSFELFGEKLNLLGTKMDDDDEFHKIVVVIDVDILSKQIGIGSERSSDACSFSLTDLYEALTNDGDSNNNEREFCLRVDRVQESSDGVSKKRKLDPNILGILYVFDDFSVREILNALFGFFTLKKEFLHKFEDFVGKKFRVIKSGLKIMKLKMKNVATFELGDICPVCLKNFEEESVVVITLCSHMFHRSCVFT